MINVWWLGSSIGRGNFGDILTPFILQHFEIDYNWVSHYSKADLICVGSIARRASKKTTVLGSGIISNNDRLDTSADWKFVRGPLTRKRLIELGGDCPEIYGDPGLLLPLIYNPSITKQYDIGYVPHNVDFLEIEKDYEHVIGLKTRNYKTVIDKILQCKRIVSSSLHGIIAAHAYGIPAAWVKPNNALKGDHVKFHDYFASVDITNYERSTYNDPIFIEPGKFDSTQLQEIFISLSQDLKNYN